MNASYSFLSKPPPPQKRHPLCPPPPTPAATRKRSSTFSAIAAWAAHVQPGSPTRSPDPKDFAIDLTGLGYTSVFVHLPNTPTTPMASKPVSPDSPPTRTRPTPLKRLRSLSILRPRSNTTVTAPSPSPSPGSPKITAASIAQRKKAVYTYAKSSKPPPKPKTTLPPSLASELALMQFADGGSTEANVKRLMEAQARAGTKTGGITVVGDVYRDGKGGIWWDREEEMEYVHLLGGHDVSGPEEKWVSFGGEVREGKAEGDEDESEERGLAIASLADGDAGHGRRGSANSIRSLDLCNLIKPAEEDALPLVPLPKTTPEPLLTIPSRPRHGQHHLRAPPNFFLLDLNAFKVPRTPNTPLTPHTPQPPSTTTLQHTHTQRKRGSARRRPAPLNIVAHVPMRGVSPDHGNDENENRNADAKKDFLEASFRPLPQHEVVDVVVPVKMQRETVYRVPETTKSLKKKVSRPLLGLFGRK